MKWNLPSMLWDWTPFWSEHAHFSCSDRLQLWSLKRPTRDTRSFGRLLLFRARTWCRREHVQHSESKAKRTFQTFEHGSKPDLYDSKCPPQYSEMVHSSKQLSGFLYTSCISDVRSKSNLIDRELVHLTNFRLMLYPSLLRFHHTSLSRSRLQICFLRTRCCFRLWLKHFCSYPRLLRKHLKRGNTNLSHQGCQGCQGREFGLKWSHWLLLKLGQIST